MTLQEIQTRIENGEDSQTEFKSVGVRNEQLAKEIVAFANRKGGLVLLGVEDDQVISGVVDPSAQLDRVVQICRNLIRPSLIPELQLHRIDGKTILLIEVESGPHKPYKVTSNNRYYLRAGASSLEPTQEELIRLLQSGEQFHFEVSALPRVGVLEVDPLKWQYYWQQLRKMEEENNPLQALYNLQLMDEEGQMTVVGELFLGRQPCRHLPQAGLELSYYAGTDATSEVLESMSIESTIPECVTAGEAFVQRHSAHRLFFNEEETRQSRQSDYPAFVIRELLANAFAHRDWSIFGQRIRLQLFCDRLTLFSPGPLPNTLNLARALAGVSYYRNPLIAQLLKDYGMMDKLGRGLQKIMRFYQVERQSSPRFEVDSHSVLVSVPKWGTE